jgi:hypothetical protein
LSLRRARAAEGGAVRTTTAAAITADVQPTSIPGQCHDVLIKTGTFTFIVIGGVTLGDRPAPQFNVAIS